MEFAVFFFLTLMTGVVGRPSFGKPRMRVIYPTSGQPKEYSRTIIQCTVKTTTPTSIKLSMLRNNTKFPENHRFIFDRPEECNTKSQQCVNLKIDPVLWIDILPVYQCIVRHWNYPKKHKVANFNLKVSYTNFTSESLVYEFGRSIPLNCPICYAFLSFKIDCVWLGWIDHPLKKRLKDTYRGYLVARPYFTIHKHTTRGEYKCQSFFIKSGRNYTKTHVIMIAFHREGTHATPFLITNKSETAEKVTFKCTLYLDRFTDVSVNWLRDGQPLPLDAFHTLKTDEPKNSYFPESIGGMSYNYFLFVPPKTPGIFQCYVQYKWMKVYGRYNLYTESGHGHSKEWNFWPNTREEFRCLPKRNYSYNKNKSNIRPDDVRAVTMKSVSVEEGKHASLRCYTPTPYKYARVNWRKDGKEISYSEYTLTFNPAKREHAGNYTCIVTDRVRKKEQATATLNVYYKPVVSLQDVSVLGKHRAELICIADANPPVNKFGWRHVKSRRKLSTANRKLVIRSTSLSDAGKYTCIATNKFGTGRATAELYVVGPQFVAVPEEQSASEGAKITMKCRIDISAQQKTIKWLADGKLISKNTAMFPNAESFKDNAYKIDFHAYKKQKIYDLIINPVKDHHAAQYTCQYGEENVFANLIVYVSPKDTKIKITGQMPTYREEAIVPFTCESKGYPYPGFRVFVNSKLLLGSSIHFAPKTTPKKSSGITYCNVTIFLNKAYHQKPITCEAYNGNGKKRSDNSLNFAILFKPTIVPIDDKHLYQGDKLRLTCQYNANPPGIFVGWWKNDRRMENQKYKVLIIKNARSEDSGVYRCAVKNSQGLSTSSTNVDVTAELRPRKEKDTTYAKTLAIALVVGFALFIPCLLVTVYLYISYTKKRNNRDIDIYQSHMSIMPCPVYSTAQYPPMVAPYPMIQGQPPLTITSRTMCESDSDSTTTSTTETTSIAKTKSTKKKKKKKAKVSASDKASMTDINTKNKKKKKKKKKKKNKKKKVAESSKGDTQEDNNVLAAQNEQKSNGDNLKNEFHATEGELKDEQEANSELSSAASESQNSRETPKKKLSRAKRSKSRTYTVEDRVSYAPSGKPKRRTSRRTVSLEGDPSE